MMLVRPASTTPVVKAAEPALPTGADVDIFANEKNPERDHVNFPRRTRPEHPDPVRHWWIPEEYFQFFYPKTGKSHKNMTKVANDGRFFLGVTGPYVFAATFTTYLCSKEIWVLEHEFYAGLGFAVAVGLIMHKVGPGVSAYLDKAVDQEIAELSSIRQKEIDRCKSAIEDENNAQWMAGSYEQLIEAKKENVALQLEAEYRARLKDAYTQVRIHLPIHLDACRNCFPLISGQAQTRLPAADG